MKFFRREFPDPAALAAPRTATARRETFLTAQLRESAPYLREAGFRETAKLLLAAADEIETSRAHGNGNASRQAAWKRLG